MPAGSAGIVEIYNTLAFYFDHHDYNSSQPRVSGAKAELKRLAALTRNYRARILKIHVAIGHHGNVALSAAFGRTDDREIRKLLLDLEGVERAADTAAVQLVGESGPVPDFVLRECVARLAKLYEFIHWLAR